jgi:uncharacterized membrane protein
MPITSLPPQDQNKIEVRVEIERPVGEVFDFYRDFRNLPRFLGDVMAVELTGPKTSRWTIQGPFGVQAHWTIKVTDERPNTVIRYETTGVPSLRARWEIYFEPGAAPGKTEVREVMTSPLGRFGRVALAMIGKSPAQEVSANLHRLKQVLETGKVTDTSYAVPGKFPQH